jgi:triacylglycerol esterase/lipase EstA (alpha/beta hydrolase family)
MLAAAGTVLAVTAGTVVVTATPAFAGTCTQQNNVSVTDPNTGWHWTTRWVCGNAKGATMYGDANPYTPTAYMDSTNSWFVCYRVGTPHAGGNNIWYYSLGDRAASGMGFRGKWGYMPAVNVYTSTDPWPGMAPCPDAYSPPVHTAGTSTTLFIHGFELFGDSDCAATWGSAKSYFRFIGYTDAQLVTFSYYAGDTNCDKDIGIDASPWTPIENIANQVAWYIYNNYSRFGRTVDVVAHSMGGLLTHVAITGTQHWNVAPFSAMDWPPYLYIGDVATLSTPFEGADMADVCAALIPPPAVPTECTELEAGSNFLNQWVKPWGNPQAWVYGGRGGTDWTQIGSVDDQTVNETSAVQIHQTAVVGHKYVYTYPSLGHSDMYSTPLYGNYSYYYCDYNTSCDESPPDCYCLEWDPNTNDSFFMDFSTSTWGYVLAAQSPVVLAAWSVHH